MAEFQKILQERAQRIMRGEDAGPWPNSIQLPSASIPRTLDAHAITSPPKARNTPLTSSPALQDTKDNASTFATQPVITQRDVNASPLNPEKDAWRFSGTMQKENQGPSLKGNPDQLREAREFLQTTSSTRKSSRNPRTPAAAPTASARSPYDPRAQANPMDYNRGPSPLTHSATSSAPRAADPIRTTPAKNWNDFLHSRPSMGSPADSPTLAHANPAAASSSTSAFPPVGSGMNGVNKTTSQSGNYTMSNSANADQKTEKSAGLFSRQVAAVNSTLNERKSDELPPHLRAKLAKTVTAATPENKEEAKPKLSALFSAKLAALEINNEKPATLNGSSVTPRTNVAPIGSSTKPAAEHASQTTSTTAAVGSKANPIVIKADEMRTTENGVVAASGHTTPDIVKLARDLSGIMKKVTLLEKENVEMREHLEDLLKKDEKRRFLGGEDASTPFTISVTYPNKAVRFIQVRWNLKVADLIRRCRAEAKLSPVQSRNPYIEFDGKRLGHGEMLGEEGRKTDMENLPTVGFFFDVAQEDSEAESL